MHFADSSTIPSVSALFRILHGCLRVTLASCVGWVGRSSASHSTMWLCLASRWKMVSLITNHVIMWKPHQPQRTNESLLDKINDSFWAVHRWPWLSTGEQGGQACMFGYNKEEMSNFALDTNETWERQSGTGLWFLFEYLKRYQAAETLNQMQQPGQCYTMIQPSGILEGSCYICSAAVKCGLEKCISVRALKCFSNVLIKVSPRRSLSSLLTWRVNIFKAPNTSSLCFVGLCCQNTSSRVINGRWRLSGCNFVFVRAS